MNMSEIGFLGFISSFQNCFLNQIRKIRSPWNLQNAFLKEYFDKRFRRNLIEFKKKPNKFKNGHKIFSHIKITKIRISFLGISRFGVSEIC
jgi:hypothetical protein